MRRILIVGSLFLAACSKGGGNEAQMCLAGQNVFSQDIKVQVAGSTDSQSRSQSKNQNELFYNLTAVDSDPSVKQLISQSIESNSLPAGAVLTAVVRNSCRNPGAITSELKLDRNLKKVGGVRSYSYVLPKMVTREELETLAADDSCLLGLSDTTIDSVSALPTDPYVRDQDHFETINASEAYPMFFDSELGTRPNSVIAIIDTGVDVDHPDLAKNTWVNEDEIPGNGIDDDRNGYIDDVNGYNFADLTGSPKPSGNWKGNYHGTHVAGLAAARANNRVGVSGVMGAGVKVMALNVFGSEAGAFSYNTENAIRYAADNGADVINMSIGGTSASASYKAAIQYAVSRGVTVLAAAGNEAREVTSGYFMTPGAYGASINGMVTVGSIDSTTSMWSSFSNYSSTFVELAAPGSENSAMLVGLLSTLPGNSYGRLQGTSMSAPVAAGAAGLTVQLLRALGYSPTPARIENALAASAKSDSSLSLRVKGGRVLSLTNLASYIQRYYPKKEVAEEGALKRLSYQNAPLPCP